jgi:hypothetical protein
MNESHPNPLIEKLAGGPERIVARPFGTPLILQGWIWLPASEFIAWLVLSKLSGKPGRSGWMRLLVGALKMAAALGSEWGHNLAHAAASRAIGKPMDELRVYSGMPRVVFHEIHNCAVTPNQHILRALGGPVFNAGLWALFRLLQSVTRPGSLGREISDVGVGTNAFLTLGGALVPIPGLDGGSLLKWGLVKGGQSVMQADQTVRRVNAPLAPILGAAGLLAWHKQRWLGVFLGMLGATALAVAAGWLKES